MQDLFTEQPKLYTINSDITKTQLQELPEPGIELRSLLLAKEILMHFWIASMDVEAST